MRDVGDRYVTKVVRRSAPKPNRPRLPPEYEELFRPSDIERATCYARMEHMIEQMNAIEYALDVESSSPGIVVDINDGDSLVYHVEVAAASIGSGR